MYNKYNIYKCARNFDWSVLIFICGFVVTGDCFVCEPKMYMCEVFPFGGPWCSMSPTIPEPFILVGFQGLPIRLVKKKYR